MEIARMSAPTTAPLPEQQQRCTMRRVQVWLGEHLIADAVAEPASAARHEAAMRAMFGDLRITNTPLGGKQ